MNIILENRPTTAGIYQITYVLQKTSITFEKAAALIREKGVTEAVSADQNALIGLWRQESTQMPGSYYGTKPLRPIASYKTSFETGAALAKKPDDSAYVTSIYSAYVLLQDLPTPQGWTPQTTLLDQYGQPHSESNTAGQAIQLATTPQAISGIGQFLDELYTGEEPDLYGYNGSSFLPNTNKNQTTLQGQEAFWGQALQIAKPLIYKAVQFVGKMAAYYLIARGLLLYLQRITFQKVDMITADIYQALADAKKAVQGAGWLLPAAIVAGGLLIASAQ